MNGLKSFMSMQVSSFMTHSYKLGSLEKLSLLANLTWDRQLLKPPRHPNRNQADTVAKEPLR